MSQKPSRLSTPIDFDAPGKQCDYVRLPHSVHRSAYGWLPIPIVCIRNGEGPTVLLMSGTHGDEYEGQVTLSKLVNQLEADDINGRLIILPMANYPAAKAGLRTSPIDELNLNRVYPGDPDDRALFFYALCFISAVSTFVFLKWLYSTRFQLALNAIRDDEEKAEAMGIHTNRYKTIAWSFAAFFLGISGGIFGNMTGFIEPLEVAFPTVTFGIFMVLMVLLGGKGTLWGPVIGAVLFHLIKEITWTYLLGWQWVALGVLIIINVVFFQQGIMGWVQDKWPHLFGISVDSVMAAGEKENSTKEVA